MEPKHIEEEVKSLYVPRPQVIAIHESFHKFVPSMENYVSLLDTYTYDSTSKKVSRRIVKRMNAKDDLEEEVMEHHVLIENTSIDPMSTAATKRELDKATKENIASMSHKIQVKDMEIERIKLELEKSKKKVTTLIINTISFDNFLECSWVLVDKLH